MGSQPTRVHRDQAVSVVRVGALGLGAAVVGLWLARRGVAAADEMREAAAAAVDTVSEVSDGVEAVGEVASDTWGFVTDPLAPIREGAAEATDYTIDRLSEWWYG